MVVSGGLLLLVVFFICLAGPHLAPNDPLEMNLLKRLDRASWTYPLGTDHLGRCILSRLLYGARLTLGTSMCVAAAILVTGLFIGLTAGLSGGWVDGTIMRLVDIFLSFPSLALVLGVIGILGPSLWAIMLGTGLAWWPVYARLTRGLVLSAREKEFVKAGRVMGTGYRRLVAAYILPQIMPPLLVLGSLEVGGLILALSGLSFLGLGVQAPTPEWGAMLNESRQYMEVAPHVMFAPGCSVFAAVLGFSLFGEGLRDVFQLKPINRI